METKIVFNGDTPKHLYESSEIVPPNTNAWLYPRDGVGFGLLDSQLSVKERTRRVFKTSGDGREVWAASIKPNQPSEPVTLLSRLKHFFRSN
jgi:hypothetical protein